MPTLYTSLQILKEIFLYEIWPIDHGHFLKNIIHHITSQIRDIRRGFYPRGRGHIYMEVYPVQYLRPIDLTEFEELVTVWGRALVSSELKLDDVRLFFKLNFIYQS